MVWIEVALAFAVLMILLSTMVSAFVEVLGRIWKWRQKGLEQMVRHVYDDVLLPKLDEGIAVDSERQKKFTSEICKPRYQPSSTWAGSRMPFNWLDSKRLSELSTAEFIERIAESPEGQQLWQQAKQSGSDSGRRYLTLAVTDLANKFEQIGQNAGEYFGRRARLTSVLAAIVFAFLINLNVIQIVKDLEANPQLRSQLIQKMESEQARLKAASATMDEAQQELGTLSVASTPAAPAQPSQSVAMQQLADELDESQEAIEQGIADLQKQLDDLNAMGLNLGWTQADIDWLFGNENAADRRDRDAKPWAVELVAWFLVTVLGGILVGLGGPFWFDIYQRLSVFSSVVRGIGIGKRSESGSQSAHSRSEPTADYVKLFERAAETVAMSQPKFLPLLNADGTVDRGDAQ